MKVLVSDTSVLIDLERAAIVQTVLTLPFEFVVPDALYEQELRPWGGEALLAHGLKVEQLHEQEVAHAVTARRACSGLSVIDTFALALAELREWTLLAGDAALRNEARARGVVCHGTLWVFDQLETGNVLAPGALHDALTTLKDHPRCRLPAAEIRTRLARYRQAG